MALKCICENILDFPKVYPYKKCTETLYDSIQESILDRLGRMWGMDAWKL